MGPIPTVAPELAFVNYGIATVREDKEKLLELRTKIEAHSIFQKYPYLQVLSLLHPEVITPLLSPLSRDLKIDGLYIGFTKIFSKEYLFQPDQTPLMKESVRLTRIIEKYGRAKDQIEIEISNPTQKFSGIWNLNDEGKPLRRDRFNPGEKYARIYVRNGGDPELTGLQFGDRTIESDNMEFFFPSFLKVEDLVTSIQSGLPTPVALHEIDNQRRETT